MRYPFFLLLFIVAIQSVAQPYATAIPDAVKKQRIDSLEKKLQTALPDSLRIDMYGQLFSLWFLIDPAKAEIYYRQARELALQKEKQLLLTKIDIQQLGLWNLKGEFLKTIDRATDMEPDIREQDDPFPQQNFYLAWANALAKLGQVDKASEKYNIIMRICEEHNLPAGKATAMVNQGIMLESQQQYEAMRDLLLKALAFAKQKKLVNEQNLAIFNLAVAESRLNNFGKAVDYLKAVIPYYLSTNNQYALAYSYANLGYGYWQLKEYAGAMMVLRQAEMIRQKLNDRFGLAKVYVTISRVQLDHSAYDSAAYYAGKAEVIASDLKLAADLRDIYKLKADIAARRSDFRKAYDFLQDHSNWKDSAYSMERDKLLQQQILLFKAHYTDSLAVVRAQEITVGRTSRYISWLVSAILLLLLGWLLIRRKNQQQQSNASLSAYSDQVEELQLEVSALRQQLVQKDHFQIEALRSRLTKLDQWQDSYWNEFLLAFSHFYPSFFFRIRADYPELTQHELRICALVKMGLSLSEMGDILGISAESVRKARYRMYKKMDLSSDQALVDALMGI